MRCGLLDFEETWGVIKYAQENSTMMIAVLVTLRRFCSLQNWFENNGSKKDGEEKWIKQKNKKIENK